MPAVPLAVSPCLPLLEIIVLFLTVTLLALISRYPVIFWQLMTAFGFLITMARLRPMPRGVSRCRGQRDNWGPVLAGPGQPQAARFAHRRAPPSRQKAGAWLVRARGCTWPADPGSAELGLVARVGGWGPAEGTDASMAMATPGPSSAKARANPARRRAQRDLAGTCGTRRSSSRAGRPQAPRFAGPVLMGMTTSARCTNGDNMITICDIRCLPKR